MENKEKTTFSTRDIYLATTLVTLKFDIVRVDYQIEGEKRNPVGYFNFEPTDELSKSVNEFWQGKLKVDPRALITNLWSLKSMVMNEYKNPNNKINQAFRSAPKEEKEELDKKD